MKDKYIGKVGSTDRDEYEYELRMDVLGKSLNLARQERHLTQEELGKLLTHINCPPKPDGQRYVCADLALVE